jgi:hypothetical protein
MTLFLKINTAVSIMRLLTTYKESVGNVFLRLTDMSLLTETLLFGCQSFVSELMSSDSG